MRCAAVAAVLAVLILAVAAQEPLPPLPADVPAGARIYAGTAEVRPARMVAWTDPDGTVQVIYQARKLADCTADVRSTIILDAGAVPIRLQHTGRMCAPGRAVDEEYYRAGSTGRWRNAIEHAEGDTAGKKFYMSLADLPEERALLVRAGLVSGGRVPLLPDGEALIERVQELDVTAGDRSDRVTHYRVHGLDLRPGSVWLDSRGELFALDPGLIRQGWERVAPELEEAQDRASQTRMAALERAIVTRPTGPLVIHSARLFDARATQIRTNHTVVVEGRRIAAVRQTTAADARVTGAINAAGMTVLPGLWETHVGDDADGLLYLAAGVTGVASSGAADVPPTSAVAWHEPRRVARREMPPAPRQEAKPTAVTALTWSTSDDLLARLPLQARRRIIAGTDPMPAGFALHRVLELHVQGGTLPSRVLQMATLGTPRAMGFDREVGSIEPGRLADLVLVDGYPTRRISDIRNVRHVVKDGALYNVTEIHRALGIR